LCDNISLTIFFKLTKNYKPFYMEQLES